MNRFDFCYSITSLKNRAKTEESKKALDIVADHLSDLILFHKMEPKWWNLLKDIIKNIKNCFTNKGEIKRHDFIWIFISFYTN